ncbi:reverse transcriptase domain-containing protein [Pannus brasiliensis CCIBt3594]|uniref:RNA-directed DNA polymerase n=1 Tax=Pannus brasiliensis CCIBt3594 TaxID=1427578 RepID=A0AAW9QY86_9CHRO
MPIRFPQGQLKNQKVKVKKLSKFLLREEPEVLRKKFESLKYPGDVANLLQVPYRILVYHIYLVNPEIRYKRFEIPKKTGGIRQICTPVTALKLIQGKLNQVLQAVYVVKPSVHGFVERKNIVTNAQAHAGKRYVLNLDLEDFFSSINFGRVRGLFMSPPYGLSPTIATILAQICCHDNQLPQGAPTSPIVTNMICAKMDSQLQRLAKECKATYTRYADDITFSTTLPKFPESLASIIDEEGIKKVILGQPLFNIIAENGFRVNDRKVRLQTRNNHQSVTGLTTNQFPNVDRSYIRQVRAMLHAWAKFGLDAAEKEFQEKYEKKSRFSLKGKSNFLQILRGKIEFIGLVKGKTDSVYLKYFEKYHKLVKALPEN